MARRLYIVAFFLFLGSSFMQPMIPGSEARLVNQHSSSSIRESKDNKKVSTHRAVKNSALSTNGKPRYLKNSRLLTGAKRSGPSTSDGYFHKISWAKNSGPSPGAGH